VHGQKRTERHIKRRVRFGHALQLIHNTIFQPGVYFSAHLAHSLTQPPEVELYFEVMAGNNRSDQLVGIKRAAESGHEVRHPCAEVAQPSQLA